MQAPFPGHPDGHWRRRQRTMRRILLACRELMLEGNLQPRLAEIARRAGLVERTVLYNFQGVDELRLEAAGDGHTRAAIVDRILGGTGRAAALPPQALDRMVQAAVLGRLLP